MKNKMKKIFSKITILVLIVAMVIPYTSIPKVEAASEWNCSEENTEYHTNYYFFTQAEHPHTWATYLATDGTYPNYTFSTSDNTATTYYTSFLYNFPSNGTEMEITSANFVDLDMNGSTNDINSTDEWSVRGFYNQMLKMYDSNKAFDYSNPDSTYKMYMFEPTDNKGESSSDSIITYLIHGPWGFVGLDADLTSADIVLNDSESIISFDSYEDANNVSSVSNTKLLNELTAATVLPDDNEIEHINIGVQQGSLGTDRDAIASIKSAIRDFNRDKGESPKAGIYKASKNGQATGDLVLRLYIRRSYETNDFFTFNNIRYNPTNGNFYNSSANSVESLATDTSKQLYFPGSNNTNVVTQGENSLTAVSNPTAIKLMAENNATHWFLAPSLFQISYKVCKDGGSEEGKVTLTYKGNEPENATETAKDIPDAVTKDKGSEFKTSDKTPTLKGYKFDSWNIDPKCDGESYEPDYDLGELNSDLTLHACWKSTDGTKGPGTGVLTYTGLFTGIIALAGGSYYIMKKKNLFRQI